MGAIADALFRFAQPLIDATDGSPEQLQRALMLSQACWNLAVTPEEMRDESLADLQSALKVGDDEFQEFKHSVVMPMIFRHQAMFPAMARRGARPPSRGVQSHTIPAQVSRRPIKKHARTGRNELCPCGSGKKYKVCCGR